ncbi:THAP domain-containing protein 1 [Merluccius polli]|uniref:THAP domain-containing protein 1 n=1 Tax=Merluccius polli TaxID=89951 RepID=A0AA47P7A1_MERPO|nr:THAP domain-containing protein 1 [Merluccius polli]
MPSCSASNCSSRSGGKGPKVSLFRFPLSDGERLRRWVAGVRRQDWRPTAGASLCALHFAEDCFLQAAGKRSLTPDAVPTIFTHSSTLAKTTCHAIKPSLHDANHSDFRRTHAITCSNTYNQNANANATSKATGSEPEGDQQRS